jgi:hypothetical protein
VGWKALLEGHMKPIPAVADGGYTSRHFFEFENGQVTMRSTISSEDSTAVTHVYIRPEDLDATRSSLLAGISGDVPFDLAKAGSRVF